MTRHLRVAVLSLLTLATLRAAGTEPPKSIVELQQFRTTSSIRMKSKEGRQGTATLVNLNPTINGWFLLTVAWTGASSEITYHLENPKPDVQKLLLDEQEPASLVIVAGKNRYSCDLFATDTLVQAKSSRLIFQPLCDGRIYLRNAATGYRTNLEAVTEFFREHVWGGENIIALGHALMGDIHRETGKIQTETQVQAGANAAGDLPLPALIDSKYCNRLLTSNNLGIALDGPERTGMTPGAWYRASGNPGIYVSLLQPNLIDAAILHSHASVVNNLDGLEASALSYLVAFDLDQFDLGFALGTEHPKVGWSDRVLEQARDPKLPGPDGIGSIAPLVPTGLVNPENAERTVATFTAGFKRTHGAFKYGELALKNHGSHYGFIENGVVFSKLQPGLSTIFVLDDGSIHMQTWSEADNQLLPRIKHARQNGVPLVEFDEASQSTVPGRLVARWGPGNWSGSEDAKLRTLRSGAALQKNRGKRFLIYAVFSDATPSAMARVFQAYRCDYAMLLDMNALEHTYCAMYRKSGSQKSIDRLITVDHLIKGMSQVDKSAPSGVLLPRFLAYPDNRDFFYLMRREGQEVKP